LATGRAGHQSYFASESRHDWHDIKTIQRLV
jgi:hypothetical protein